MAIITNIPTNSILQNIRITGVVAATNFMLPAGAVIRDVIISNSTANAITGGVKIGTTAGGVDVVAALTVGANANAFVTDALILKRFFSPTAAQQLFIDAVAAWNSANVQIDILYYQL